jgi:hypothetical protein
VQINSKDEEVGAPLVITSQQFWDNISKENPGVLGQLSVSGTKSSAWLAWILLALAGVLIIVCAAIIVKRH